MYKIRGSDGREYGPVNADLLKQWIAQGRVAGHSLVQSGEGGEWKPLSAYPEFGEVLRAEPAGGTGAGHPLPSEAPEAPPPTSGMAIASLVLGLLGCFGITALVGMGLGIVSLIKINKSQGRLGGQGLAIAGICVSGFMLVLGVPMFAGMMLPALARAKSKAATINCMNNVKQVCLGIVLYASDHKDTLPPATTWCDAISPEIGGRTQVLRCNADPSRERSSYGFNAKLGGLKLNQVNPRTVLIFECRGGWNVSGGPDDIITHHRNIYLVGFVDGHAEQLGEAQLSNLRWDP